MGKPAKTYPELCIGGCGRKAAASSGYCGKKRQRHTCIGVCLCAGCGKQIPPKATYCRACAARLGGAAAAAKREARLAAEVDALIAQYHARQPRPTPSTAAPLLPRAVATCHHCGGLCRVDMDVGGIACWQCGRRQPLPYQEHAASRE